MRKHDLMKLIVYSLSIVLLAIGINFAHSQISNETNTTLSLPAHGNKTSSTLLNINNSETHEKNSSIVNSSALQFKFKFNGVRKVLEMINFSVLMMWRLIQ